MDDTIREISIWAFPLAVAVILHECAHGWVANRLGDPTAARMGRLTLNPLSHVDPVGTILVPLLLVAAKAGFVFGWAKPVPVNFLNLRNPKRDMVKVALAGPLTNLVLAVVSAGIVHALAMMNFGAGTPAGAVAEWLLVPTGLMAVKGVQINIILAVFNLLPIPPLDGGRVLVGLLPTRPAIAIARMEPYGMLIVMALLLSESLGRIIGPVVFGLWRLLGM
jgi:Zn-dependent protease